MASSLYSETPQKAKTLASEVGKWHERITVAKKVNDEWAQSSGANRFIDEYKGKVDLFFKANNGTSSVRVPPINSVFAYVQSDIASTSNRDPYLTVNPKAGTTAGAKLIEVWTNYMWRELKTKEELELEILDKDLVGFAWHKVGHTVESEGTGNDLRIQHEGPYSLRVDWRDLFWNVGALRPPNDCEWMAQRIIRPLEDVKEKFPAAKKLEGSLHPSLNGDYFKDSVKSAIFQDDMKVAVLYEVWDRRKKQIYLLAEGLNDRYLQEPRPWPEYLDEFPFLMYWDFAVPGQPRPMSAIAPWEPQMLERTILLAQALNHAKRWNRQMLVEQGAIDPNSLDKFERGDDGAIIEVNGKLEDKIKFVDFGQLSPDFYMLIDRLAAIENEVNGQPAFDRGSVTKTNTRTIGELQLMKSGAKSRTDRKVDRLETHLENIARHMIAHMKANFDFEQVVKVTGEEPRAVIEALGPAYNPETGTVTFTPEDIQGEYDVEVRAGSTLPLDKESRIQVLEMVLQNIVAAATQSPGSNLMVEIIQQILHNYDIKGLQEAYEKDLATAAEAQAAQGQNESVDQAKGFADAEKRKAQAQQIQTETEIMVRQEKDRSAQSLFGALEPQEEEAPANGL